MAAGRPWRSSVRRHRTYLRPGTPRRYQARPLAWHAARGSRQRAATGSAVVTPSAATTRQPGCGSCGWPDPAYHRCPCPPRPTAHRRPLPHRSPGARPSHARSGVGSTKARRTLGAVLESRPRTTPRTYRWGHPVGRGAACFIGRTNGPLSTPVQGSRPNAFLFIIFFLKPSLSPASFLPRLLPRGTASRVHASPARCSGRCEFMIARRPMRSITRFAFFQPAWTSFSLSPDPQQHLHTKKKE